MNTNKKQLARPSRSRIMRARAVAWLDRHDDAVTLTAVALIVACVSALMVLALATDYGVTVRDGVAVGTLTVALSALASFFAYMVGSERATSRVSRRYARAMNEQSDKHERAITQAENKRNIAQSNLRDERQAREQDRENAAYEYEVLMRNRNYWKSCAENFERLYGDELRKSRATHGVTWENDNK